MRALFTRVARLPFAISANFNSFSTFCVAKVVNVRMAAWATPSNHRAERINTTHSHVERKRTEEP